jgi:uncharacterized protein (DUF2141 family)
MLAFTMLLSSSSFSQLKLSVEIANLRNDKGKIMLQLFDEKQNVLHQEAGDIKDKTFFFSFTGLKPGKYAVRFYHDENQNQIMETNRFGKPTEGYGFSNNVTGKFSMPPFEQWLFELSDNKKITLNAVY